MSENARECYFYWNGDWGKNLINICTETFSHSVAGARDFCTKMAAPDVKLFLRVVYFFAMIFVFVGAIIFGSSAGWFTDIC